MSWQSISGNDVHNRVSKASDIRYPILRVVHKLIVGSFLHRSTHEDKVQKQDLWILKVL